MHGTHQGATYFNSRSRNTKKDIESKSNNVTNETNETKESKEEQPETYKCRQKCSSRQKTFSTDEELELHNKYFHTVSSQQPPKEDE